jgi:hypothetical protein
MNTGKALLPLQRAAAKAGGISIARADASCVMARTSSVEARA